MSDAADQSAPTVLAAARGVDATLARSYTPADHEKSVWERWERSAAFHAEGGGAGDPYCVLIPPPNVTAALHLGHALNNTLQDVLIRCHRMRGCNTLWMPGTDHAGIATQTVVERRLQQQRKRRTDFTRDEFIAIVQEWKDEYAATILSQLQAMGCSCDFARTRFTMDSVCTQAVREAFFRLFADGLIYRGKRLVNWDPVSQTALADDEVEMEPVDSHMWYLRYPLTDGSGHVTVATTRPETMLGDTAVAVNPRDPRAAKLRGKSVRLPLVDRVIPIVEDDFVVMPVEFGGDPGDAKAAIASGFLKVTPAHDPNDWDIGIRHHLQVINVLAPDGSISDRHGWSDVSPVASKLVGLSREAARTAVVAWFKSQGLLEECRPYRHSVGHSYRSHVPIEPYLSDQWYVRVTDARMRGSALDAMAPDQREGNEHQSQPARPGDGGLRFFPSRYARSYQQWHEGIRDWCISRQLWWGHRIPVWHKRVQLTAANRVETLQAWGFDEMVKEGASCGRAVLLVRTDTAVAHALLENPLRVITGDLETEYDIYVCARTDADGAALERHGFARDSDVLDTWFSSALWPLSTMGWPQPSPDMAGLLDSFNPSSVLSTAREIITLWVSRMVMFNRYFRGGALPFKEVFIHCVVQDGFGQKMSKSLGNGVDPRDIIATHGADALRFVMAQISTDTQDVRLSVDLLCPHTGVTFAPKTIKTSTGHEVAAPVQDSPSDPRLKMATVYGVMSGLATPSAECPLARNTSSRFDIGRNFANKVWNASRFALSQCAAPRDACLQSQSPQRLLDRWMVSRVARAVRDTDESIANYRFNEYAQTAYELVWRDLCDWYLEAAKATIRTDPLQQQVLRSVLDASLRLLHPLMPFVTEALWQALPQAGEAGIAGLRLPSADLLARAQWPRPESSCVDEQAESDFAKIQSLVEVIRNLRGERKVEPRRKIVLHVSDSLAAIVHSGQGILEVLAGIGEVRSAAEGLPADALAFNAAAGEGWVSALVDAVDAGVERERLERVLLERERVAAGYRTKLGNAGYLSKAKPDVVEQTRGLLSQTETEIAATRRALKSLGAVLALALVPALWLGGAMALSGCGPEPTRIDPTRSTLLRSSPENPLSTGEFEAQRSGRHGERIEPWNMGAIRGEVMETESYRIRSTLRDPYLRDVLPDFMEHALNHYRSGLAPLPAPTRMLETWVFGSRDEWAAYTKSRLMGDAAPYLSLGRGGYTTQSHAILYDIGPVDTLSIASHEGWHQYSQTVLRDTLPSWLEEGIACFMEGYRIRSQEESALFIPWRNLERFGELRGAVRREKLIPLESLISRQPQDFLAESRDGLLTYYAQVWALVHYLNEGEQGKYRTGLTRILADAEAGTLGKKLASESSRSGVSVDRAAVSVYFSHDFPAFTSGYEEFVRRATVRGAGDAVWHGRSPLAEESLK